MQKVFKTDEEVEEEIARLLKSPLVKLAKKEQEARYRRRQYMYQLRWMEKRGRQLEAEGMTMDKLRELGEECPDEDFDD